MLVDLQPAGICQGELFESVQDAFQERRARLFEVIDTINAEMGKRTLRFSAEGVKQSWKMRRENLTPGYTSNWDQLVSAR